MVKKVAKKLGIGMTTTHSTLQLYPETSKLLRANVFGNTNNRQQGRGEPVLARDGTRISPNDFLNQLINIRNMVSVEEAMNTRRREVFRWTKADLNIIMSRIQERIFKLGLNSRDNQMAAPRRRNATGGRSRNQPYRFDTGELYRSISLKQTNNSGDLDLSFRREKVVIKALIERYGDIFKFSPSDIQYVVYMYLKRTGRIPKTIRAPKIRSAG